jgi:hypothetical protein
VSKGCLLQGHGDCLTASTRSVRIMPERFEFQQI